MFLKRSDASKGREPILGEVVLIEEENRKRKDWKIGRIVDQNFSKDGRIRSVDIKTPNKRYITRPLNKIYPLEVFEE